MTKDRLHDLELAFERDGWEISNREQLYEIADEHIRWELTRHNSVSKIHLEFYVIGDLGEVSMDLRDISKCTLEISNLTLYFIERASANWQKDVRAFVRSASNSTSEE